MAGSPRNSLGNVRSDMDITYPEHLSRLHRHSILTEYPKTHFNQKKMNRNRRGNRYRTQPVTFDEIQEVDEENTINENVESDEEGSSAKQIVSPSKLQLDFFRFSRALDHKRKKVNHLQHEESISDSVDSEVVKSNGEQQPLAQNYQQNQLLDGVKSWTDYTREGSI